MLGSTLLLRLAAVIRHGSVRQAAQALHISQPALSQSIRELEAIVGMPLFERSARGLRPTPAGLQLGVHADVVTNEIARTSATIARLRHGGPSRLLIGASASICASALPEIVDHLLREGLASEIRVHEGMADPLMARLAHGELDVVVAYLWNAGCADPGLVHERIGVAKISVVCRAETARLAMAEGVGRLADESWVVMTKNLELKQRFEHFYSSAEVPRPRAVVETDSISFALRLLQGGAHVGFMPLGHASILDRERFVSLEIDGMSWARGVGVFQRAGAHRPPALARLVALLHAHYARDAENALAELRCDPHAA